MKRYIRSDRSLSQYDMSGFNDDQQYEIRSGLKSGVDVSIYADPKYGNWQMEEIRLGLESGVDVTIYADLRYDYQQMREIRKGLEAGLDVDVYADPAYDGLQMAEIRAGLEKGLDVSIYADPKYNDWQMWEIRRGLEAGVDVSTYADPKYTREQMRRIREKSEKKSNRSTIRTATAGGIKFDPDVRLDQSEYDDYQDKYGAYPVAKYFIASPGYYGYGGYGSDWCATYYEMSDGSGLMISPYYGDEKFSRRADMIKDIKQAQKSIREEIRENGYDEDGGLLEHYDFI